MKEHGFDDTPKHSFVQLLDGVWRAAASSSTLS